MKWNEISRPGEPEVTPEMTGAFPGKTAERSGSGVTPVTLVDLTAEIRPGMPKPPSAPEVTMTWQIAQSAGEEREKGYSNKLEQFTITTHVSTHFDAPSHFTAEGKNIDQFPLSRFYMVPTVLLDVPQEDYGAVTPEQIQAAAERAGGIRKGDLVILNTGFYRHYEDERYLRTPYLTEEAARYLADAGAAIVAIDCFTVDDVRSREKPAHVLLLKERGIPIIECVVGLDQIPASRFRSICFPLRIREGSGAFTRLVGVFENDPSVELPQTGTPAVTQGIRCSPRDNVAIVLRDAAPGDILEVDGLRIPLTEGIPYGHKAALAPIRPGEEVIKYGEPIARCTEEIPRGGWVHVHNVESIRGLGR